MVEDVVVKEPLTDSMVEVGDRIILKLEEMGLEVTAALWFYDDESNDWRLQIAFPNSSDRGSREFYSRIRKAERAIEKSPTLPSRLNVRVLADKNQWLQLLRSSFLWEVGMNFPYRISRTGLKGGRYVEDIYIYRLS